jgi:predicted transcriptional regulator
MLDLFNNTDTINNLRIAQVTKEDVIRKTDKLKTIISLLGKHKNMYPEIDNWIKEKVIPGIKTEERVAYIGFDNEIPFVSAIVKKGKASKFCHLHIDYEFRNKNIGGLFFSLMTLELKRFAKEIHFTLPESLWSEKKYFFNSFGFEKATKSGVQYRLFEEELKCSAPIEKVWESALEVLPKLLYTSGIVMSINPIYCNKILKGNKVVEIRKKFNNKWIGSKVALYSTHPTKAIVGNAMIEKVEEGVPENIWKRNSDLLGCTKKEFDNYTALSSKVYALTLNNIEPYHNPIHLSVMSDYVKKELKAPQSYQSISTNKHWAKAISITELMHGRLRINQIQI